MKNKTLKGTDFYALICDDERFRDKKVAPDPLICGVYPTKKEAQIIAKDIKDCICRHYIKKCNVQIFI